MLRDSSTYPAGPSRRDKRKAILIGDHFRIDGGPTGQLPRLTESGRRLMAPPSSRKSRLCASVSASAQSRYIVRYATKIHRLDGKQLDPG